MNVNKRQKIPITRCDQLEESQKISKNSFAGQSCHGYALDTLPPEVLEMILRLLPLHDVATSIRLVSKHCSAVAATVLNGAFIAAGAKIKGLMIRTKYAIKNAKTNAELLACVKANNVLELIRVQYKMLRACTWRYTHPPTKQHKIPRLCFYAGSLLDDMNELLLQVAKYDTSIINSPTADSYVARFAVVCKRFMNFFEKISERKINRSALISGCKVVDVLDCLVEGREVLYFKASPNRKGISKAVSMRLRYTMKRTWFTCLEISKYSGEHIWREEQRVMYLRLRRLVSSVNEHFFENSHYEQELPLQFPLKPPPASTYSGYGVYDGQFFYYGNMNQYAYESKFMHTPDTANVPVGTEEVPKLPSLNLIIDIELKCTPELAPLAVRRILKSDQFEIYEARSSKNQHLYLRMNIKCHASKANRLPGNFMWQLRSPRVHKKFLN